MKKFILESHREEWQENIKRILKGNYYWRRIPSVQGLHKTIEPENIYHIIST